ncbi:carboxylesterase/lipase family protein [Phenylobacterium sp. CCH12-B4]|uniref:carboxylesterase/lipase family protein n=1 Tax=Phenylobacterium sp. CCH12-B4 TaxID=1768784 RepID=UPI00350F6F7F
MISLTRQGLSRGCLRRLALATAGFALLTPQGSLAQGVAPAVSLTQGVVRGSREGPVEFFRGLPYAAPPVGDLRWRAPGPPPSWIGVREARDFGPSCMQLPFAGSEAPLRAAPSEDCLYLNVWRPAGRGKPAPVLVWIHGGGYVYGGTSPAAFDGAGFARDGLVVVSLAYRLGRFGFFAHPALAASGEGPSGNWGFMDQQAALRWVQANIGRFGGDPTQVTVMGESAGGGSVLALLGSPSARGLFHRAVIMSGGGRALTPARELRRDQPGVPSAETIGRNFAARHGIEGQDAEALRRLRALPAAIVAEGVGFADLFRPQPGLPTYAGPFVDGDTLTSGGFPAAPADVPVMVGATSADLGSVPGATKDEVFALFGADRDRARALYDPSGDLSVASVARAVGGDRQMVEPARHIAQQAARRGHRAYHYRFSYVAESRRPDAPAGAPHATDVAFAFDTLPARYGAKVTPRDAAVATAFHRYIANFARTGDPNGRGLVAWPPADLSAHDVIDFTAEGQVRFGPDPWRERLDLVGAHAPGAAQTADAADRHNSPPHAGNSKGGDR